MVAVHSSTGQEKVASVAEQRANESYMALVWRRLRRSFTGMVGLILVVLLILIAVFADFFAPMDPRETGASFTPPQVISVMEKRWQPQHLAAYLCLGGNGRA